MPEICDKFIAHISSYPDAEMRRTIILGANILMSSVLALLGKDISQEQSIAELEALANFINTERDRSKAINIAFISTSEGELQ